MGTMQAIELKPEGSGPKTAGDERSVLGDAAAGEAWDTRFAALAEEHSRFLFRIAYGLLRNPQDAEDAVQESLLRIYRAGMQNNTGAEIADTKAYLARTVWRAGLDLAARRPKRTEPIDTDDAPREFPAAGPTAEQALAEGDERALLKSLIVALPEDLRQPLVLSAIEEMTSREVAAAVGIPEGTVRTRVMRARAELRRRFEAMRARGPEENAAGDR
jgi:RNA polymerase sigma-70 factor (ECF subfamily)